MHVNRSSGAKTIDSLRSWLIDWLTGEFGIDRAEVDPGQAFLSFGMNSVQAMTMVGDLESTLGLCLPPTLAWDYPNVEALSEHLAGRLESAPQRATATRSSASPTTSPIDIEAVLADLDLLSDEDVDGLLQQYLGDSH